MKWPAILPTINDETNSTPLPFPELEDKAATTQLQPHSPGLTGGAVQVRCQEQTSSKEQQLHTPTPESGNLNPCQKPPLWDEERSLLLYVIINSTYYMYIRHVGLAQLNGF